MSLRVDRINPIPLFKIRLNGLPFSPTLLTNLGREGKKIVGKKFWLNWWLAANLPPALRHFRVRVPSSRGM